MNRPSPVFRLERPSLMRSAEFLDAVGRSRTLHEGLVEPPTNAAGIRHYILRKNSGRDIGHFVIADDEGLAGVINLNDIKRGSHSVATLGYYAFAPYTGRGLMRNALKRVACLAFERYALDRLEANIQPGNTASLAMVEALGFRYCSFHPKFMKLAGRHRDHQRWVLTLAEWHIAQDPVRIRA